MPQQEQAPAPQTCVSRGTATPHFIAPPLAPQATEAALRTARTTAQVQVQTCYRPRIVSRETFGTCAYRRAHPQTRNHASTAHQPRTNDHRQQAGCHPSAAPRSVSHERSHLGPTHPLARAPAPRRRPRARRRRPTQTDAPGPQARAPPSSQAHGAHKPFTPASRAGSARGPRASARRPRRARSTQ